MPSALPQVLVPFLFRCPYHHIYDNKLRKGFASLAPSTRVGYPPSLSVLFSAFAHTRLPHHAWPNFISTVIHLLSNECSRSASLPFARYSLHSLACHAFQLTLPGTTQTDPQTYMNYKLISVSIESIAIRSSSSFSCSVLPNQ